jgi:hypothetical protein
MITYTYNIISKPTAQELNDFPNVIVASVWEYTATRDEDDATTSIANTTFFLPPPVDDPNFIPYDEVTDELVFSWISAKDNIPALQLYLASQLPELVSTTTSTTTIVE